MKRVGRPLGTELARPADVHRCPCSAEISAAAANALRPFIVRGLGFDLHAAVCAHHVRVVVAHTVDQRPLPSAWAIQTLSDEAHLRRDEVVLLWAPLETPVSAARTASRVSAPMAA